MPGLAAQAAAAMTAVVVEGADLALAVAQHDHAFMLEFKQEIAARLVQLRNMPGQQPGAEEDAFVLGREDSSETKYCRSSVCWPKDVRSFMSGFP